MNIEVPIEVLHSIYERTEKIKLLSRDPLVRLEASHIMQAIDRLIRPKVEVPQ